MYISSASLSAATPGAGALLASWNGSALALTKASVAKGASMQLITDVSCVSVTSCAATVTNLSASGTTTYGFTDVLAGKTWKLFRLP
jgi:hypothetical protein